MENKIITTQRQTLEPFTVIFFLILNLSGGHRHTRGLVNRAWGSAQSNVAPCFSFDGCLIVTNLDASPQKSILRNSPCTCCWIILHNQLSQILVLHIYFYKGLEAFD